MLISRSLICSDKKCSVSEIPHKPRGRPPILLELDEKLIKFLCAVRNRGGVVNKHVVRATAKALIDSNPSVASLICLVLG